MQYGKNILLFLISLLLFGVCGFCVEPSDDSLFSLSIEQLMEIPVVVSSSRQEQPWNQTSAPVTIITADDIHYSGATNLGDILNFVPGLDFLKNHRYWDCYGIRGLHDAPSDRSINLIDGRLVDNPSYGGSHYARLPLFLEDIERIEVVRGPGSAAWGANALNGVANIIKKKPRDTVGVFASTTWNTFGDNYNMLRFAESDDDFEYRISAGYKKEESSSDAISNEHFVSTDPRNPGNFESNDKLRSLAVDTEFIRQIDLETDFSFGAAYDHSKIGSIGFLSYYPDHDGRTETLLSFAKLNRRLDDKEGWYLQWYGNFFGSNYTAVQRRNNYLSTVDGQYDFIPAQDQAISIGGSFKWYHINEIGNDPQLLILNEEPLNEMETNLFIIHHWDLSERFTFETQLLGNYFTGTGTNWAARLTSMYAFDDEKKHIGRLSFARGFRTPMAQARKAQTLRFQIAPSTYMVNMTAPNKLRDELVYTAELGYAGQLSDELSLAVNSYLTRYEDMIGYNVSKAGPLSYIRSENSGGADAYGVETELKYAHNKYIFSVWHAYNGFAADRAQQPLRAFKPARHKVGFSGRLKMDHGVTLNTNIKHSTYTDASHGPEGNVRGFNQIDLTITKAFNLQNARGELQIGVIDALNEREEIVAASGSYLYPHEVPGRIWFAGLKLTF